MSIVILQTEKFKHNLGLGTHLFVKVPRPGGLLVRLSQGIELRSTNYDADALTTSRLLITKRIFINFREAANMH